MPDATAPADFPSVPDLMGAILDPLAAWMRSQRWFAGKSAAASEASIIGAAVVEAGPTHRVIDTVVRVGAGTGGADYQVPLLVTPAPDASDATGAAGTPGAEIAVLPLPGGPFRVEDATRTDEGREALLRLVTGAGTATGEGLALTGEPARTSAAHTVLGSRLLSGEQSNSSMIFELEGAPPVIAKLFRVIQAGENPDVVVQGALDAAGSEQVAPLIGSARAVWGEGSPAPLRGHALFVQEFFAGVEDAWRVALRDAETGTDFSAGARTLGEATARVHRDLATHLPTVDAARRLRERMVASMLSRLAQARAEVAEVDAAAPALDAVIRRALDVDWPPFQRVHGDYHLGQVLSVPARGWVLLDFEGEPMRPLAEREQPDCTVRDVAGMLRSLDYVAGAVRLVHGLDASTWARDARAAFLEGYTSTAQIPADDAAFAVLLAAFEADKAVYEAVYEARNRPDWLPIPLGALERLAA